MNINDQEISQNIEEFLKETSKNFSQKSKLSISKQIENPTNSVNTSNLIPISINPPDLTLNIKANL